MEVHVRPGNTDISHVLQAIGLNKDNANGTVRITFGDENTLADVDYIARELIKIVNRVRSSN